MRIVPFLAPVFALVGCASPGYTPPASIPSIRIKIVDRPVALVLGDAARAFSSTPFTVKDADPDARRVAVGFQGPPDGLLDCGEITLSDNALWTVKIAAAGGVAHYQQMSARRQVVDVLRTLELEARTTLAFDALASDRTRVTASTQYRLVRRISESIEGRPVRDRTDEASFASGSRGHFPTADAGGAEVECVATGELEASVLEGIR